MRNNIIKHWTAREDLILRNFHLKGLSRKETARLMGRSEGSIRHRKLKLGLTRILRTDVYNIVRRRKRKQMKAKQ